MRLTIENLAYIHKAEIHLNGITCIAGENNVGKSTVGKVLFSLVFALTQYRDLFEEDRIDFVEERLRLLRFLHSRIDDPDGELLVDAVMLLKRQNFEELLVLLEKVSDKFSDEIKNNKEDYEKIKSIIHQIQEVLHQDVESVKVKKGILEKIIRRTFEGQVSPLHSDNNTYISLKDINDEIISVQWEKNSLIQLKMNQDIPLSQAIYIESPYVFQFMNIYQMARRVGSRTYRKTQSSQIPEYIRDLLHKMVSEHPNTDSLVGKIVNSEEKSNVSKTIKDISNLIGGEMLFDQKKDEFVFSSDLIKEPIKMANVASGIKSLSIIQRLLQNGWFNEFSVLIIDEPENHLHPKWQIEFARFLVDLYDKVGVKVVITSHSPYFIEALDVFTKKRKIEKHAAFYLAEDGKQGTIMKDVTNHLEVIFDLLSEPLDFLEEERL